MDTPIILWDHDGTITSSKNPNNKTSSRTILPGVKKTMDKAAFNFIISGFRSPESELQNFDPDLVTAKFINLMNILPIQAVAFSPAIGGIECHTILKTTSGILIKKAHEEAKYKDYIGKFKKPDIGMLVVMKGIAEKEFHQIIHNKNTIMIGDTWHDKESAHTFGIPFMHAQEIHSLKST